MSPARVKPLLLDLESSMLTMRPPDAATSCYISYQIYLLLSNRIHIFWKLIAQLQLQISSLPRMLPSCVLWSIYHLHNNTVPLTFKKLQDQKLRSGWLRAYNIDPLKGCSMERRPQWLLISCQIFLSWKQAESNLQGESCSLSDVTTTTTFLFIPQKRNESFSMHATLKENFLLLLL